MAKKHYQIDGARFWSLDGFYEEISSVLIPGVDWGKNLDAFNDVLRGGFGTPNEGFILQWRNSEISKTRLGYEETVRQLERRLKKCHPESRSIVSAELQAAKRQDGPSVFDWLIQIIQQHGPGGEESVSGVELVLF